MHFLQNLICNVITMKEILTIELNFERFIFIDRGKIKRNNRNETDEN